MRITGTKIEVELGENERLIQVDVPPFVVGNFNTYHNIQVDSNSLTVPAQPRPVCIRAVILLVEEQR